MKLNQVYNENCLHTMAKMPDNFIDLTVTSPPYDNLRMYNGYSFDFENVAKEIYRVTKKGGALIWVVGDATDKGSESGTSFKQALYFKDLGFNLHDTMIWDKVNTFGTCGNPAYRYAQNFEYMFVFSKGKPKSINLIKIPTLRPGEIYTSTTRRNRQSGGISEKLRPSNGYLNKNNKIKSNICQYQVGFNKSSKDKEAFKHSAIFPEKLAEDHIITWSDPLDLIYDPFMGSGTTAKMAILNDRRFIGSEISSEYCEIIEQRLKAAWAEIL